MENSVDDAGRPAKAVEISRQETVKEKGEKILRARPVAGEIDHEALSREFMARFPKIRAALAK